MRVVVRVPWHYLTLLLRAADLFGFGPGAPDPVFHVAAYRYLLAVLAVAWAALLWTGRRRASLALGIAHAVCAVGFWALALGRPQMVISRVDLPAPLAPMMLTIWPRSTRRLTPCRASMLP